MTLQPDDTDWSSHRLLVLDRLDRVSTELVEVRDELRGVREEVSGLKVKVALWSAAVATIGTSIIHAVVGRVVK